ncbi:MAG: hypothetical protein IT530_03010 [Burkholderiales bacterium]|nr:hypothetical protein [Burkholderiales bacterium]
MTRRKAGRTPRIDPVETELRSDGRLVLGSAGYGLPTPVHARPDYLVTWRYGVVGIEYLQKFHGATIAAAAMNPQSAIEQFLADLRTDEQNIVAGCTAFAPRGGTPAVEYIGTYCGLGLDSPDIETVWGYYTDIVTPSAGGAPPLETIWSNLWSAPTTSQAFKDAVNKLVFAYMWSHSRSIEVRFLAGKANAAVLPIAPATPF